MIPAWPEIGQSAFLGVAVVKCAVGGGLWVKMT